MAVALKTMRRADAEAIRRFKQEFRTLADVSHPNLVALHELATDGSIWFFTMELIEGVDFLRYVRSGTDRPDPVAPTTVDLARPPSPSLPGRRDRPRTRSPTAHRWTRSSPGRIPACHSMRDPAYLRLPWTGCESPSCNWPRGWPSSTGRACSTAT